MTFTITVLLFLWRFSAVKMACAIGSDQISEAIAVCREKLRAEPHFPKMQHSLAQLLDSRLDTSRPDIDQVSEVIELYRSVGQPSAEVEKQRLPPPKVRFESLMRAATISRDALFDTRQAISYFLSAIAVEGVDNSMLIAAFEQVMLLLLSKEETIEDVASGPIEVVNGEVDLQIFANDERHLDNCLQTALRLCEYIAAKCPNETLADEFKGATLRKGKQPLLAYQSYQNAMNKARSQYIESQQIGSEEYILKLCNFMKTSILASAAGREAGLDSDQCLSLLAEAESVTSKALESLDSQDAAIKLAISEKLIDLYNNMGIIEKERENYNQAYLCFRKALEIKADDGHALVQLASIEDKTIGHNFDTISNIKSLDAEYVSALFDGYSIRFESELVDKLQYRGHVFVYSAMKAALAELDKAPSSVKSIIDLGCGTGLLGDIISNDMPSATLVGVDLSQRMAEVSRARKTAAGKSVYSSVIHGDALQYLATLDRNSQDCILASDVFIYIGDISQVLSESSKCLVDSGIVAFTVESLHDSSEFGLRLLKSGRFGHSKKYIQKVADENGFKLLSWDECVLRQQGGADVNGATVVLVKS
jgi:predicted TPR repeat methyltransferase